jgi:HPt (histidine-containing phosphotransfer) domain-containing protein
VVDGDRGLLRRMVEVFLGQCPKLLGDIRDSILHGDCVALVRAAHKLKASLGSFGAQRAYQAALQLEELGGATDVTRCQHAFPELEEAVKRLQEGLADLLRGTGAVDVDARGGLGIVSSKLATGRGPTINRPGTYARPFGCSLERWGRIASFL